MKKTPIDKALDAAGGQSALARALGLTQQSVHVWMKRQSIPATRVLAVEKLTGVSRHSLRPDIYPVERIRTPNRAASAT